MPGTTYKAAISVGGPSALPRDRYITTPHFNDTGGSYTPDQAATLLAAGMVTWLNVLSDIAVSIYEVAGAPPHFPVGHAVAGTPGTVLAGPSPGEIALCLSYYASFNRPRYRGRLYLPFLWIAKATSGTTPSARPTAGQQASAMAFASTVLHPLEAHGWQWSVYSTVDHTTKTVSNYYCDDEWDTQRRRGQKPTARVAATYP
jgi:hypothetical protein